MEQMADKCRFCPNIAETQKQNKLQAYVGTIKEVLQIQV